MKPTTATGLPNPSEILTRGWPLTTAGVNDSRTIDGLELVELPAG